MRLLVATIGACTILAYAVLGAFLMAGAHWEWDAAAAFAVVRPLYQASAVAAVVAVVALIAGIVTARRRAGSPALR